MTAQELARLIDHTLLKAETTAQHVRRLCAEAATHEFRAVCINPTFVPLAVQVLADTPVAVASVVGFPLGGNLTATKVDEARRVLDAGAREVDMVINLGVLLDSEEGLVRDDIAAVAEAVHQASREFVLKVILETAALSGEQIRLGCRCCVEAGADFVKTSTGFHPTGGATLESVRLLKQCAAPLRVKASGGIRDLSAALAMVQAGADRLGCSASVAIMKECQQAA